ncbi:MAG: hypothetical protein Kapaf2KO_08920 [Candidatus Kapaibacteriales bacterium]
MNRFTFLLISLLSLTFISQSQGNDEFLIYSADEQTRQNYINYIWDNGFEPNDNSVFISLQRLIEDDLKNADWKSAVATLKKYKEDIDPVYWSKVEKLIDILEYPLDYITEVNLGDNINSEGSEYSPLPSADGKHLYYTGYMRSGTNTSEDIYMSDSTSSGWGKSKLMSNQLNTKKKNEAPQSISTDNTSILLFGAFEPNYLGKGDIYHSERTQLGWSEVAHYPEPINSPYFDVDAKITADRKWIIFTSDRPGGIGDFNERGDSFNGSKHGNTDIYVIELKEDGSYGEIINLGETINTPYAERKPFLHPDGRTLYYSSDGGSGLGRLDLYMSKRKGESWTDWSEPVNLGKEINTAFDDSGVIVTTFGDMAYFATQDRGINYGQSDIYTIDLPERFRPDPVAGISGKAEDTDGLPVNASIYWEDLESGEKLGMAQTDPSTGEFYMVLPMGFNYGIVAERPGYYPASANLDLRDSTRSIKKEIRFQLQSLDELFGDDLEMSGNNSLIYDSFSLEQEEIKRSRKTVKLNNIFFEYKKADLLKSSHSELNRVADLINNYPVDLMEISGHTDSIGGDDYNQKLSEARAKSVVDYLVSKGVDPTKLKAVGYGEERPVASNSTEEGRQQNRRVEMELLKHGKIEDNISNND